MNVLNATEPILRNSYLDHTPRILLQVGMSHDLIRRLMLDTNVQLNTVYCLRPVYFFKSFEF